MSSFKRKPYNYEWLPQEEKWRIAYAWRQCCWYPKHIFRYIWRSAYGKDLEQTIELAVYLAWQQGLDEKASGKFIQKELHGFLNSIGIRRINGGVWVLREWAGFQQDVACLQLNGHGLSSWWAQFIEFKRAVTLQNLKNRKQVEAVC